MSALESHLKEIGAPHTPEVCAHIRRLVEQEQREDRKKRGVMFVKEVFACASCTYYGHVTEECLMESKDTYGGASPSWCPMREKE